MYEHNHLARSLQQGSIGREAAPFLIHADSGSATTYGEFFANAERMAAALVGAGVKPGGRVAVQAPKTVAMLELYIGCVLSGAVFLPLNTAYTPAEVGYFLGDAEPALFVCDPAHLAALSRVAKASGVPVILTLGAGETGSLVEARDAEGPGFQAFARAPDDLAAILYTSGTTGRSKGAMLSHRALASNSETLKQYWRFTTDDVLIHALPIFHTHGLFVASNVTMMAGASAIFLPAFRAEKVLAAMPKATALMGVPTFYTRLLELDGLADATRFMRLFVSGSAPLLAETHERWLAITGHAILERYGMTETNMNTSNPYEGERRPGTVGFPLPGVEAKVCNADTGAELPQGEIGVLEVRGANLFSGYWRMAEKTAAELRADGFFITGDIARIDEDGYIHIVGRARDMVISGGFNIYPKEIELVIDDMKGVLESAVIGVPHPDFGEAVVAVVVSEPGASLSEANILAAIAPDLARFKQPKWILLVPELPRNTMGKVQKNQLREDYAALFA
jgi:malonyl-CoA/methylmalonyl-CoA synthetase